MHDDLEHVRWCKSRHSTAGNVCIEVAGLDSGHRAVRDSKDTAGPALRFTSGEWTAFTAGVRDGEFD